MKHIKIRRAGIERIFKKIPFREWLNEQPRKALTYKKGIANPEGVGWAIEDFLRQAWSLGLEDLRIGTVWKWTSGHKPRALEGYVRSQFKTVRF